MRDANDAAHHDHLDRTRMVLMGELTLGFHFVDGHAARGAFVHSGKHVVAASGAAHGHRFLAERRLAFTAFRTLVRIKMPALRAFTWRTRGRGRVRVIDDLLFCNLLLLFELE